MIIIVHIQRTVLGRKWEYLCKMLTMVSDQKILAVIISVFKTTITNAFFMSPVTSPFWDFLLRPLDP